MVKKLTLILIFTFFTMLGFSQSKNEKTVAGTVEILRKAMIDGDTIVLEKILMDQLSYGHSGGNVETKKEFINSLTSGKSDFVTIDLSDQSIIVSENTALVRHKLFAETNNRGTAATIKLGILLVFQKEKNEWRLLARQAVKIN